MLTILWNQGWLTPAGTGGDDDGYSEMRSRDLDELATREREEEQVILAVTAAFVNLELWRN